MEITIFTLYLYFAFASFLGLIGIIMGIKKIDGSPFITVVAGLMLVLLVVFIDQIEIGRTDERSILVSTIEIAGEAGSNFTTTHYNVTTGSLQFEIGAGTTYRYYGEELGASSSLIGDSVSNVCLYLAKLNNPTGTAYLGVWGTGSTITNANYKLLFGTKDVSTLTTSETKYCFAGSTSYTMTSGDTFGIFYNGGSLNNNVLVTFDNTNPFDGTNSYRTRMSHAGAFDDSTAQDIKGSLYLVTVTEDTDTQTINSHDTVGNEPIYEDFSQNDIWVFTILLAMMFMFIGVMLQFAKW